MAYTFKPYEESDAVKQYRQQLEEIQLQKPGEYQSQYAQQLKKAQDAALNREKFQYNLSSDPLYQQYKQQYQRQGKLAMKDTVGQAAAMNGGYGSSYGQMAGQQAYNGYLQQLNDRVPELYQLALSKYQQEGQEAMDRLNMLGQLESKDYSRYQDALANWQTERGYYTDRYDNERNTDYNMWSTNDQREYSRYQDQQQLAQAQVEYLLSIGVQPDAALLDLAGYNNQYVNTRVQQARAAALAAQQGGYGGGGSGKSSGSSVSPAKFKGVMDLGRGPLSADQLASLVAAGDVIAKNVKGVIEVKNAASPKKTTGGNVIQKPVLGYSNPLDLIKKK